MPVVISKMFHKIKMMWTSKYIMLSSRDSGRDVGYDCKYSQNHNGFCD